jgi:hypothetical protein
MFKKLYHNWRWKGRWSIVQIWPLWVSAESWAHILLDESSRPNENVQVENDTNESQQQVPHKNPIPVSQIDGALVNWLIAGPKRTGDDGKRHDGHDGDRPSD